MKEDIIKKNLSDALLGIYELDITQKLTLFLQGEQAVLFALSVAGISNPSIMSAKLGLTRSRMSMILTSLKKKDMIYLETDEEDRRRTNVILTKKGKKFISSKEEEVMSFFDIYIENMGEKKVLQLIDLLNDTVSNMKEVKV